MKTGAMGEELAVRHLRDRGYIIIERNYRTPLGEIDIIARHGGAIVFIEVKTRRTGEFGMPFEAVNRRKQERMRRVALVYLKRLGGEVPARFDVVSVMLDGGRASVDIIQDAFGF